MTEMLCSRFADRWNPDLPPARIDRRPVAPPAELIDAAELARRLGIARSTVYANARRYAAIRLGDSRNAPLRFDYAAVLASLPRVGQQPVEMLVPLPGPIGDKSVQRRPIRPEHHLPSLHMDLTEDQVIAAVACPHLGCKARRGQRCRHKGGTTYKGTYTHRGRWLKLERDLRTARAVIPPHD